MSSVQATNRLVVFDTETGGLTLDNPTIQIAAAVVDNGLHELDSFEIKIQFDPSTCTPEALAKNHYDPAVWAVSAHPERKALARFAEFLDDYKDVQMMSKKGKPYTVARLAAFNGEFDGNRMRAHYEKYEMFRPWHPHVMCIRQLATWWFWCRPDAPRPEDGKLETLAKYFGVACENAHDALADCRMAIGLLKAVTK